MQLKQIPLLIYSSIWEIRNCEIRIFQIESRNSNAILIPWGVIECGKIDIPTLFLIPWGLQIEFGKFLLYTQLF